MFYRKSEVKEKTKKKNSASGLIEDRLKHLRRKRNVTKPRKPESCLEITSMWNVYIKCTYLYLRHFILLLKNDLIFKFRAIRRWRRQEIVVALYFISTKSSCRIHGADFSIEIRRVKDKWSVDYLKWMAATNWYYWDGNFSKII